MRALLTALILTPLLSACGVRGGLDVPPPLWGDKDRAAPAVPSPYEANDLGRDPVDDPLAQAQEDEPELLDADDSGDTADMTEG